MAKNVIAISMQEYAIKMTLRSMSLIKIEIYRMWKRVEMFIINREPYVKMTSGIDPQEQQAIVRAIAEVKAWGKREEARLLAKLKFLEGHLVVQRKALARIKAQHARPDYSERGGL